jgi:predicted transcriptional regulator
MSGERRLRIAIILFLALACFVLVLAGGVSGEDAQDPNEDQLLRDLNGKIYLNGTYFVNDEEITFARGVAANSFYEVRLSSSDSTSTKDVDVGKTIEYIVPSYNGTEGVEVQWEYSNTVRNLGTGPDNVLFFDFQGEIAYDLVSTQQPKGDWNNDIGDTALASGALIIADDDSGAVIRGIEWLQEYEDPKTHSWGTIDDDSKAIMALDSAGVDVWDELAALMLKQKPDGSFGGIEETSWAVIALSTNYNDETVKSMERAVTWLRDQEYDNNQDLALAALAEQYYEDAKFREGSGGGGTGSDTGFIPPPWMYVLSFLIIGSIILSYQLFARLERDGILDGPRKDIYKYVTENPGEHLANITKTLGLSSSSIRYHLSVLEGMDLIVTHKNGKYKRFYINKNGYSKYTNGNGYKHIMSALKNNTARNMVKFLLSHPKSNQKRVSKALDIHPSTVTWHAKRLEEAEIISKQRKGKEIHYSLNSDVQLRKVIGIIEGSPAY